MKRTLDKKKIARNVANALAAVPIDNKQERDAIRAKLRRKYTDLKPLKLDMNAKDRRRFEELGELIDRLEAWRRVQPKPGYNPAVLLLFGRGLRPECSFFLPTLEQSRS
jgi:hypothetical protein